MARDPSSEVSNAVRAGRWTGGISRVIVVLKKEGERASPLPKSARTVTWGLMEVGTESGRFAPKLN